MTRVWYLLLVLCLLGPAASAQAQWFGQNKVQYGDFHWNYITSEHFDVYFYEGGYDLAVFSVAVLESAYVEVSAQLDHRLRRRIPTIIYQSHNEFQQTNVTESLLPEGVGGFTESFKNRMVMPFTGSYEDFRHVLHHELTHAVTFDKMYGEGVGSIISRRSFFDLPLWFAEGFAEYSSRHGWDTFADMVIRDATVHGYLIPLEYVGGYLAYKQGQSAVLYLAERYGEAKIAELLNKGRFEMTMDNVLRKSIGMGEREFNEEWQKRLRKEYWPEISQREEPKDFATQLTDHEKDGSYYNDKPVFSPRGDRLALISERADYTEVKIVSAVDGKKLQRVLKGGSSDRFESLHSYLSGMSFSPDGSTLALIAKSGGADVLYLANVDGDGKDRTIRLSGFTSMRSPTYAPDGQSVVLVACRHDANDLYRVDLATEQVTQLTDDRFDEQDPEFAPNGNRLVFAGDRPADSTRPLLLGRTQDPRSFRYGRYNIFEADLDAGVARPITNDDAESKMPVYAPDGERICYVSNLNGIYNLYVIDSGAARQYPITDALSGCFSPTWSPDGQNIAFSAFFKGGFDVFLIKEIRPRGDSLGHLTPTAFVRRLTGADTGQFVQRREIELEEQAPKVIEEDLEFTSYVKRAESPFRKQPLPPVAVSDTADTAVAPPDSSVLTTVDDSLRREPVATDPAPADSATPEVAAAVPDTGFEVHKYRLKFSPDLVTGGLGYDTFFGLRGQSYFVISDYLGDHQIFIASDLINTIDQSNIQIFYAYRPKRIDWGIGMFHSKYYYLDFEDRLFSDRTYGFQGIASRPFSRFTRLELDAMMIFIDRRYYDPNAQTGEYDDRSDRVGLGALSLVHDNANWGLTGPMSGRRYRLTAEAAPAGLSEGIAYQAVTADVRQYIRIGGRYSLGLRAAGGVSGGDNPKRFYLGGVSNWIGSDISRSDVYDVDGLYFSQVITPFRGYDYYAISGNKFAMANIEFRFPFVDYLQMRFPLPMVLSRVGGALFTDIGAAWSDNDRFQGATSQDGFRLKDIKMSFGYGLRANLGFVVLRFDQAWRTDLNSVADRPAFYFSLGADY